MKKKTAVVFGTFAPLHQGHIDLIQRAKRQCDRVWVVVSGYEEMCIRDRQYAEQDQTPELFSRHQHPQPKQDCSWSYGSRFES